MDCIGQKKDILLSHVVNVYTWLYICLLIKFYLICASGIMYGYVLYGHLLLLRNSDIT
jgi:hypothetical protein